MNLASSQPRPQINQECAHALGVCLRQERETRNLSTQDVADKLLLSKNQVIGLESGDLKYFYGTKLFAQAADKYAAFLDFAERPSDTIFDLGNRECAATVAVEEVVKAPPIQTNTDIAESMGTSEDEPAGVIKHIAAPVKKLRTTRLWAIAVAALALVAAIYQQLTDTDAAKPSVQAAEAKPTPTPTETTAPVTPPPAAVAQETEKAEPASKVVEPANKNTMPAGAVLLSFTGSSWVQSVDQSGSKQEKTYRAGDTLTLQPEKLQALIIGNVSAVTVSNSTKPINLSTYVTQGSQVARLIGPQIRQLAH